MDADRFDALTHALASRTTRRISLTALSSLALGGLLLKTSDVGAKKRKKKCKSGQKKCGQRCIPASDCCGGCGEQTCCTGSCANLQTDGKNCGACGEACASNVCLNGNCKCNGQAQCPSGCFCALNAASATVCVGGLTATACTADADCASGVCRQTAGGNFCGEPCLG